MFQGASFVALDTKGRLSVPTRHRDVLNATASGQLTMTKHPHGCLMIFPRNEWEKFRDRIASLPMQAHWSKRLFLGDTRTRPVASISTSIALPRNSRLDQCACIGSDAIRSRNFSHSLRGKIIRQPCGCLVMVSWPDAVALSTSRCRVGTDSRPLVS